MNLPKGEVMLERLTVSGPRMSRRTFNALLLSAGAPPLAPAALWAQAPPSAPRPFRVEIPQAKIDRILSQVRDAEWPDRLDAPDLRYGVSWDYMKELANYWTKDFDWRKAEANLNKYPQFLARVGDYDVHFYHVKGRGPKPLPLILTHGWPGSVFEFLNAIGPLSDPASFGGSPDDAFDVIVPSLPGFGFSSKPRGRPIGAPTVASLWNRLMTEQLGYQKYGAQGGDIGSRVTVQLALNHKDSLVGVHFNGLAEGRTPPPDAEQTPDERAWRRAGVAYLSRERDYFNIQINKTQTIGFALGNNPLGAAAWVVEKLKGWSDSESPFEPAFTKDQVLTNVMIYLVTNTMDTSVWMYRGREDDPDVVGAITIPTGYASLPREIVTLAPPRHVLERNYNLVRYTKLPHGGHFAFWEQPELMVADVRQFFRPLRT
jgi:pimeloyl-ACP methyl ester carboxylesterase